MTDITVSDNLEARIIAAARQIFIENGFAQTSMSDIAARVGINRPVLHYYFHTKEKMYRAVFSGIVSSLFPKIQGILQRNDLSIAERVGMVVDAYYAVFRDNPGLPLFVVREMHRDINFLIDTISSLGLCPYLDAVMNGLTEEMESGRLKRVPLPFVFYTFYGLLTTPFLVRRLTEAVFLGEDDTFYALLDVWKPCIVKQMEALLAADD